MLDKVFDLEEVQVASEIKYRPGLRYSLRAILASSRPLDTTLFDRGLVPEFDKNEMSRIRVTPASCARKVGATELMPLIPSLDGYTARLWE